MKIIFSINYHTSWGQKLYISGSNAALGEWDKYGALEMEGGHNGEWRLQIEMPETEKFEYHYFVKEEQGNVIEEWGKNRIFSKNEASDNYKLIDSWQDFPSNKSFYSSVFTKNLFRHNDSVKESLSISSKLTIKVFAPLVEKNQSLAILGNQRGLNFWDSKNPVLMSCSNYPEWEIELDVSIIDFPLEYKFLVVNTKTKSIVRWENGFNRQFNFSTEEKKNQHTIISGFRFQEDLPEWKGAGMAIPVFSLRSKDSYGIGDFDDLRKMVDWAKSAGLKMIQILPINDTTVMLDWTDSYPYRAISIYALHPMYLSIKKLGDLRNKDLMNSFKEKQLDLNKNTVVNYEAVYKVKWAYFQEIFNQEKENILTSIPFQTFFKKNEEWLIPYAAFCHFRDVNHTADFRKWETFSEFDREKITDYCKENYDQVAIYYYLQYQLDKQLYETSQYAAEQGVALKGDIPIGIGRDSVDVWTEPELFNLTGQAGAPPDDFSKTGQNWGFPTYNWNAMEKDGFQWWLKRFRKMADFFEAYRIDHILGFFRIWEIPAHSVEGLLGQFNPALPLSDDELISVGLQMNEERFLKPYIREFFLNDLFGEYTEEAKLTFLNERFLGRYDLKDEFDTQRKVEAYFLGKDDKKSNCLRRGLYVLINEVLFVRDNKSPEKFHPRITAQFTYSYMGLNSSDKQTFDNLYEDFYYKRHNEFWKKQALKKLPALIACSDMLVCAEDLGMIPQSVPEVMDMLQMLSLEIQRMPKKLGVEFGNPAQYPYLSVCTTSSHDTSTLRGWWEEDKEATQRYFNNILCQPGTAPDFCEPWICEKILMDHLYSPSMWAIFPLQDWFAIDSILRRVNPHEERINVPVNPQHYWQYRMHFTIEDLMQKEQFADKVKKMVESTVR